MLKINEWPYEIRKDRLTFCIRTCALAASSRSSEYLGIESNSATVPPVARIEVKLEKGGESGHSARGWV
jgi:hypothetical protein